MIKKYIFLGAPGVGKGTMAALLAKENDMIHISTGEIFREAIKNETKLGIKVKQIIDAGDYVPDELTNAIVAEAIDNLGNKGYILDGFPRTINQVEFLEKNYPVDKAFLLEAPKDSVIKRLLSRGRSDDTEETIKNRINVYETETKPLINFYTEKNILVSVDSSGSIEENLDNMRKVF